MDQEEPAHDLFTCIRPLCEHEEGWHLSKSFLILPDLNPNYGPYLTRIMNIIKNGSLSNELQIFLTDHGDKLLRDLDKKSINENSDISDSYLSLRRYFIEEFEKGHVFLTDEILSDNGPQIDLKRCELKNGKKLWLCKEHSLATNAKILNNKMMSNQIDQSIFKLLDEINQIRIDIF